MPVHHRLRFLTFPMRTSRLCSLWPAMRPLRFRRVPFGRDVAFDPGGATASRIAMPHMLPSTVPSVSASAKFFLSWLNPTPHPITVYASHPPSPTTAQHSLPGGALPPYRGRSFTGRIASASPDAPEPEVRIHLPPALSHVRTRLPRSVGRLASTCGYHCPLGGSGLSGCGCHTPGIWAVSLPAVLVWNELRGRAGTENCRAPTPSARQDGCERRREAAAHADSLAERRAT